LLDEIEKIAEELVKKKDPRWKRILKGGAGYVLGSAAGVGTGMLIERGVRHIAKTHFPNWTPDKRLKALGPLLGLASVVGMAANQYGQGKLQKMFARDEDE
jgi:hypothetical protein